MKMCWVSSLSVATPDFVAKGDYEKMSIQDFVDQGTQGQLASNTAYFIAGTPPEIISCAPVVTSAGLKMIVWVVPEVFYHELLFAIQQGRIPRFSVVTLPVTEPVLTMALAQSYEMARGITEESPAGIPLAPSASPPSPAVTAQPPLATAAAPAPPPAAGMPMPPPVVGPVPVVAPPVPPKVKRGEQRSIALERPPAPRFEAFRITPTLPASLEGRLVGQPGVYQIEVYASTTDDLPGQPAFRQTVAIPDSGETVFQFSPPGKPGERIRLWLAIEGYTAPIPVEAPIVIPSTLPARKVSVGKPGTHTGKRILANTPVTVYVDINVKGGEALVAGYLSCGESLRLHSSEVIAGKGRLTWNVPPLPPGNYRFQLAIYTPVNAIRKLDVQVVTMLGGKATLRTHVVGVIGVVGREVFPIARAIAKEAKDAKIRVGGIAATEWTPSDFPEPISPSDGLVIAVSYTPDSIPLQPTLATVVWAVYSPPPPDTLETVLGWGTPVVVLTENGKPYGNELQMGVAKVLPFDPSLETRNAAILGALIRLRGIR